MIDPNETPVADTETEPATDKNNFGKTLKEFLSVSGSFSRTELLIATAIVFILYLVRPVLLTLLPGSISPRIILGSTVLLYAVWGVALGKRSRDLGTTFTYGMVVGMLFPIIGIVFLFQEGAKYRASKAR